MEVNITTVDPDKFSEDCEKLKKFGYNLAILEYANMDPVFSLQTSNQAMAILSQYMGKLQMDALEWYREGYEDGEHDWIYGGHGKFIFNQTTGEFTSKLKPIKFADHIEPKRFRILFIE
jgi:hypothetical protein